MSLKETWRLWEDGEHSPFLNMAVDELLLEKASGTPLIRIYDWDRPSVSIGYVQDYYAAPREGYTVVRRLTGGGIVFHDSDLTYTVVIPSGHPIDKLNRMESYQVFHKAVLAALAGFELKEAILSPEEMAPVDRASMQCFTTPTRYDVVCEGKKYAGAAQRRTKRGILHQGSISLEASKGDKNKLILALKAGIMKELMIDFTSYGPDEGFMGEARLLAERKYRSPDWNIRKYYHNDS